MKRLLNFFFAWMILLAANAQEECKIECNRQHLKPSEARYFQQPLMEKYDIKYLKLDLNIESANTNVSGSCLYKAIAGTAIDTFALELMNYMTVDSAFINGTKLSFLRRADHILIPLPVMIPTNATIETVIYYKGTPTDGLYNGVSNTLPFTYSLSESFQARHWFPAKQLLADKIDSTDIWVTTSNVNKVASNGLLQQVVNLPNNKVQYRWKTRYLMAYYLPSVAVGRYAEYKHYAKPANLPNDSILVQHYVADANNVLATNLVNLNRTANLIETFSTQMGLYPFWKEKYGHAQSSIGGGMEHQTMSTMVNFSMGLVAHELGHQWFGDYVTCATWNDIWVNEGFASYSEYLAREAHPTFFANKAADYMAGLHNNIMSASGGSVYVPLADSYNEGRIFSSRLTYNKGGAIIHSLRFEMQSDDLFFKTLRQFQQQYANRTATGLQFKAVAEAVSGKNFTDFFNQWYFGEGYPTYSAEYGKLGDNLVLNISHVSSSNVTPVFKGLLEVKVNHAGGDTTVVCNITSATNQFKFRFPYTPKGITIDPRNWIINKVNTIDSINIVTSVNNINPAIYQLKVLPNPAKDFVNMTFKAGSFTKAILHSVDGKKIVEYVVPSTAAQFRLSLLGVQKGMYLIELIDRKRQRITSKVVVQ
jgi:aminopeptidase N